MEYGVLHCDVRSRSCGASAGGIVTLLSAADKASNQLAIMVEDVDAYRVRARRKRILKCGGIDSARRDRRCEERDRAVDLGGMTDWRNVVKHIHRTPVRRDHQVVLLHRDVGYLQIRKIERERFPLRTVVPRNVESMFGSGVEQAGPRRVFSYGVHVVVGANAGDDLRPRLAPVVRAVDVGRAVVLQVTLGCEIRRAGLVM